MPRAVRHALALRHCHHIGSGNGTGIESAIGAETVAVRAIAIAQSGHQAPQLYASIALGVGHDLHQCARWQTRRLIRQQQTQALRLNIQTETPSTPLPTHHVRKAGAVAKRKWLTRGTSAAPHASAPSRFRKPAAAAEVTQPQDSLSECRVVWCS